MSKCQMENHRPFTMNKEYLNRKEENLTAYTLLRHQNESGLPYTTSGSFRLQDGNGSRSYSASEENLVTVLSAYGIHLTSLRQLARLHADEFDAELDVISHVSAYFDIASQRIIDDIPQVFETIFALRFFNELKDNLASDLKLVGDGGLENCKRYVRDEPDIQMTRDKFDRQRRILKDALDTVDHFYMP